MSNRPLEKQEERKRKAATLSYPVKPDGKGSARVNFCGKAYYFGAHNSRESFSAFGEWRRQMIENGEATEPKLLRLDLAIEQNHLESVPPEPIGGRNLRAWLAIACSLILALAIFAAAKFSSSAAAPVVDGTALTEGEMEIIRGIRSHRAQLAKYTAELQPSVETLTRQLIKEGPRNGKRHQSMERSPDS